MGLALEFEFTDGHGNISDRPFFLEEKRQHTMRVVTDYRRKDSRRTLTPEEKNELETFPPGYKFNAPLPPAQLQLRRAIARKIHLSVMTEENEWWSTRPQWVKDVYQRFPAYEFYGTPDDDRVRRLYGFCEALDTGEHRAHVVTGMIAFNNDVIGGVPLTELVIVQNGAWSDAHLVSIRMSATPWLFYDPLAYLLLK